MGQVQRQTRHGTNTGSAPTELVTLTCTEGHTFLVHASARDLVRSCSEKIGWRKKCHAPIKCST